MDQPLDEERSSSSPFGRRQDEQLDQCRGWRRHIDAVRPLRGRLVDEHRRGGRFGGHLAVRRNLDLTYIVMDNQTYGLTKGQLSPTSPRGAKSVSSALGSLEEPVGFLPG